MKNLMLILSLVLLYNCASYPVLDEGKDWAIPGLREADGSTHNEPKRNKVTGKTLNVLDFGAVSDDENFDNSLAFKAAIGEAQPGDEIYIPEGTFYFSEAALFSKSYVSHITLVSGVNLRGAGMDKTVLVSKFPENINNKYKTAMIVSLTQSDIVMSDFSITSLTPDSMLPDPDVSNANNRVGTAPVYGIVVDNGKPTEPHGNVVINNISIEKFERMAIRIRVVRDVLVSNVTIQKATDLGGGGAGYGISIQGRGNAIDITGSNLDTVHNIVRNCTIKGPYIRHGILLQYYAHNNLITENVVMDTLLDAIDLHGEDEYSNEISHNTVINTRRGAAVGIGNSGATHDAAGPYNWVHNNTFTGNLRGLDIVYGSPKSIIEKNIFDGSGIFLQSGNHTQIIKNTFKNILHDETDINSDINDVKAINVLYSYKALAPETGVPEGINISGNTFENITNGIYVEAHTENFTLAKNKFTEVAGYDVLNENASFEVPPISDVVIPRQGELVLPTDDNFITNESRRYPQTQPNMKLKASTFDIPYNRMVYMKFDLTELPSKGDNIYLRFAAKSKDGLATLKIHGTTEYTDWKETTIFWENAKYHKDQVAAIDDPNGELTHVTDFTFTTVGTEFNVYYVNITDYIRSLDADEVTLIMSNDDVENMYCEVYSKEIKADDMKLGLLFSND